MLKLLFDFFDGIPSDSIPYDGDMWSIDDERRYLFDSWYSDQFIPTDIFERG